MDVAATGCGGAAPTAPASGAAGSSGLTVGIFVDDAFGDGDFMDQGAFEVEPRDYPWNARCAYFTGPDDELWELYAWYEGGEPGAVDA